MEYVGSFMCYDLQISLHWLFPFLFLIPLFPTIMLLLYQRFKALYWTGENGQLCPVSDFSAHALNFSFIIILAVGSLYYFLYTYVYDPYIASIWKTFIMNRLCNFSKTFSALIRWSCDLCPYIYFMYYNPFIDLDIPTNNFISGMKSNWSWSLIYSISKFKNFGSIFEKFWIYIHQSNWLIIFFFAVVWSLSGFGIRWNKVHKKQIETICVFSFIN